MELLGVLADLPAFADRFWKEAGTATVFLFHGEMGAGKTTTIAALCAAKGVTDPVSSPTFSIINEYAYAEAGTTRPLYHIDLYRLNSLEEMVQAGVEDCVYSGAVCFVEWPERAPELFDESVRHVVIKALDAQTRQIKILTDAAFAAQRLEEQL